jgi:hypothetical protein
MQICYERLEIVTDKQQRNILIAIYVIHNRMENGNTDNPMIVMMWVYIKEYNLQKYRIITHGAEPPWEVINCAATQELPSVLWNPKVHYRRHKSPPLVPILSQIDPIHTIPAYRSKIHFNIVHPPTSWSSQWSRSLRLSHQYPICIPPLPPSCYMPFPSHPPWLDHSNYTWRRVQVLKLLYNKIFIYGLILQCRYGNPWEVIIHLIRNNWKCVPNKKLMSGSWILILYLRIKTLIHRFLWYATFCNYTMTLNFEKAMNDNLEKMWNDSVVACFKVLQYYPLAWWEWGNSRKTSIIVAGL